MPFTRPSLEHSLPAMTGEDRKRGPRSPSAARPKDENSEALLSRLTRVKPGTSIVRVRPSLRRYQAKCKVCKDVGRVKIRGEIGLTEPCPACDAAFVPHPARAEVIINSVIRKPKKR